MYVSMLQIQLYNIYNYFVDLEYIKIHVYEIDENNNHKTKILSRIHYI